LGCDAADPQRIGAFWAKALDLAEREQLIRAKVAELVEAGASALREESYGEDLGHVVMLDPEGSEFCVA
jgi:hypothetical protein